MLSVITDPIFQFLLYLSQLTGSFGVAIVLFTLLLRFVLAPLSVPALRSQKKMQALKPELDALKKQFGHDKKLLQQEQMKLYQQHNLNPIAGCLPMIIQVVVLIGLYQVLISFLPKAEGLGIALNTQFLWVNLAVPDPTFLLAILAGVSQLVLSLMILPGVERHDLIDDKVTSPVLKDANKKEGDMQDMAEQIQKQMVFMMPVITGIAAAQFPSGLALYWVISTLFSIGQQWVVTGPGGLGMYSRKALLKFTQVTGVTLPSTLDLTPGTAEKTLQAEAVSLIASDQETQKRTTKPQKTTRKSGKKRVKVVKKSAKSTKKA